MDYILVENNSIVGGYPRELPKNWKDVSNFYLLDNTRLRQYGWFPVRVVPANKSENDVVTGQRFEIGTTEVVQYEEIRQKTQQELQEELNIEWENVRGERDKRLLECDWTQLPDVNLSNINDWKTYRQALRDITTQSNPKQITWPIKPDVITG